MENCADGKLCAPHQLNSHGLPERGTVNGLIHFVSIIIFIYDTLTGTVGSSQSLPEIPVRVPRLNTNHNTFLDAS